MYIDLQKYCLHPWYQIASFPQRYTRGCDFTRAIYTYTNNKIEVLNECFKFKNNTFIKYKNVHGTAESLNNINTRLKITFNILPFIKVEGLYYILDIVSDVDNQQYLYVLVGGPDKDSLWILSINTCIPKDIHDQFILKAKQLGYDTNKLEYDNFTKVIPNKLGLDKSECKVPIL